MGAAKRRGCYEERKKESVERHMAEEIVRKEKIAARVAAMSPEEREQRQIARKNLASVMALASVYAGSGLKRAK